MKDEHPVIAQTLVCLHNAAIRLLLDADRNPLIAAVEYFVEHREDAIEQVLIELNVPAISCWGRIQRQRDQAFPVQAV